MTATITATYCELCGSELLYNFRCADCDRIKCSVELAVAHAGEGYVDIVEWVRKVVKTQIAAALKEKA